MEPHYPAVHVSHLSLGGLQVVTISAGGLLHFCVLIQTVTSQAYTSKGIVIMWVSLLFNLGGLMSYQVLLMLVLTSQHIVSRNHQTD